MINHSLIQSSVDIMIKKPTIINIINGTSRKKTSGTFISLNPVLNNSKLMG